MASLPSLIARGAAVVPAFFAAGVLNAAEAFDPVAATEAYIARLPAEARARSDAYFEGGYWLLLFGLIFTLLVWWIVIRSGIARRLRDAVESRIKKPFARCWVFAIALLAILSVFSLPLEIYRDFWREHHFGLSNMSFDGWFAEQVTALILLLVMAPPVIALIHSGIRKSPARWWVAASLATPFFILFFALIAPVFIAPLFNKYDPITDPAVRDPILAMARANGVPADNVYQFDASRQHKRVSANVSGALGTIRISLNDNLLARCPPEGVMAVMGHELGHYVLNHVYERTVYLSLMFAGVYWFVHIFAGIVLRRRGAAWGITGPADLAAMPVLFAGFAIAMFPHDSRAQLDHARVRNRGRSLRAQLRSRARRDGRGVPDALRISQTEAGPDRGDPLLLPPERLQSDPRRDALEGGEPARGRGCARRRLRLNAQCSVQCVRAGPGRNLSVRVKIALAFSKQQRYFSVHS